MPSVRGCQPRDAASVRSVRVVLRAERSAGHDERFEWPAQLASCGSSCLLFFRCPVSVRSMHPDATVQPHPDMEIRLDDLAGVEVRALLAEHLQNMHEHSPPESVHALDVTGLLKPEITFWTVWSRGELLGCGALKELTSAHGEIKSMRTVSAHRRKGVARAMLEHIIAEARRRSYARVSLETGSMAAFEPARRLYESFGFKHCPPFGDYREDPNSVFLTHTLEAR